MIRSMTAFARKTKQTSWGHIAWELRSSNHRYLDINLNIPETLTQLESSIHKRLKSYLQRGKINVTLYYDSMIPAPMLQLNAERLAQVLHYYDQLKELIQTHIPLDPLALLRWPGILQTLPVSLEDKQNDLLNLFDKTLKQLITVRQEAGSALLPLLLDRVKKLRAHCNHIQQQLPDLLPKYRQKLLARSEAVSLNLDTTRLEQEVFLYAQKIDVQEEMDRLRVYLDEFEKHLHADNPAGKHLDFILQELNRETNTLGAKSAYIDMSLVAIEAKVLIEEMREQVQNLE